MAFDDPDDVGAGSTPASTYRPPPFGDDPPAATSPVLPDQPTDEERQSQPLTVLPDPGVIDPPGSVPMSLDSMVEPAPAVKDVSKPFTGWPTVEIPPAVAQGRASIQRAKLADEERLVGRVDERLEEDRERIRKAYDASGVGPGELPNWDYEAQRKRTHTDPIESFGSMASVFAILAAAFTKAPMENALLGSAAAMNAIRSNNEHEYERAFEAWKANTDLALKRHNIMQQQYQNAIALSTSDMNMSRQQLLMLGTKYDDKQMLFLLENGMDKELMELLDKRAMMAVNIRKAQDAITESTLKQNMLQNDPEWNNEDPDAIKRATRKMRAYNQVYHPGTSTEAQIVSQYMYENPKATALDVAKFRYQWFGFGGHLSGEQAEVQAIMEAEARGELLPDDAAKRIAEIIARKKGASASRPGSPADVLETQTQEEMKKDPSISRAEAQLRAQKKIAQSSRKEPLPNEQIRSRMQDLMKPKEEGGQGLDQAAAFRRASQEVKRALITPTGNRYDDIRKTQGLLKLTVDAADKAETLLNKKWGITGIGGMITRPMAAVGNMTSISSDTDRAEFQSLIAEIKELNPRVMLQSTGRPLSIEAKQMDLIIRGLNAGDTVANTKRRFRELRQVWGQIAAQLEERAGEDVAPPRDAPRAVRPQEAPAGGWWKNLPGVK